MKKKSISSIKIYLSLILLFICSKISGQEFGSIENVEKLFTLTSKQIDSLLISQGYEIKSKEIKTKIITYKKSLKNKKFEYTLNLLFKDDKLESFGWEDYVSHASFMISGMNDNYKVNEAKTKDSLGLFYLESKNLELDAIIFKTEANTLKGKISFTVNRRNKDKIKKKNK